MNYIFIIKAVKLKHLYFGCLSRIKQNSYFGWWKNDHLWISCL